MSLTAGKNSQQMESQVNQARQAAQQLYVFQSYRI